jgi:hypothetical protein
MLSPRVVKYYKLSFSIGLFLALMAFVHWLKPAFMFDPQGQYREFGLGHQRTTVFPIWLVTIILAIFSYLTVSWYIMF